MTIRAGEIIGLVGANGAGKSTLMRILAGVTRPDTGQMLIDGRPVDWDAFGPRAANAAGTRIAWQELSLCPNLSIAENFYIERPNAGRFRPGWTRPYRELAAEALGAIFPGTEIVPDTRAGALPISGRQMVEIARVLSDPGLRLAILDEPTSSLGAERSAQLRAHIRAIAGRGVAVVFISHKLAEVIDVADRVLVMRNGRITEDRPNRGLTVGHLVEMMGGLSAEAAAEAAEARPAAGAPVLTLDRATIAPGSNVDPELRRGEIVGFAGLEGSGQKAALRRLFTAPRGGPRLRFVSGDRPVEGNFPLWTVLENITVGRTARRPGWAATRPGPDRRAATEAARGLALDPARLDHGILDLSGGNQQKALMARAIVDDFDALLLDDPTRGVDIAAKREFYRLARELAGRGKLILWHSTEDGEFAECDRVLVFSHGRAVRQLERGAITDEALIAASFSGTAGTEILAPRGSGAGMRRLLTALPFLCLALIVAAMTWRNPMVASALGAQLLLGPAVPLVLVALGQMFAVGGSEIDLGIGPAAGLVNVVSATLLVATPWLGVGALLGILALYALMGLLIRARAIPSIVVTLGASFIWLGMGQTLQPRPGGSAPDWLAPVLLPSAFGIPAPVIVILLAGIAAAMINASPAGTVLRGFGASPLALERAGWSTIRYTVLRYLLVGGFASLAGLMLTAMSGASDINAGRALTLLSIAAVVIGGCRLLGGVIAPWGVVAGAVTLSLIGAFLATLGVSTDYNAAVQGALLIAILALQSLSFGGGRHA
nr:ATP-binding cassette domain-containing protein [Paracoccus sp. S-4012]